jgi:hypothetical protein
VVVVRDKLTCDSSSRKSHGLRLHNRIKSAIMIAVPHAAILHGDSLDHILSSFISSRGVQSPDMFPIDLAVERVLVTSIRIAAGQVVCVRMVVCVIVTVSFGLARHGGHDLYRHYIVTLTIPCDAYDEHERLDSKMTSRRVPAC